MVGAQQNLNRWRDVTTPLSGIVSHSRVSTWYIRAWTQPPGTVWRPPAVTCTFNLCIKFNVFAITSIITQMYQATQNIETEVVWGGYGSHKVIGSSHRWGAISGYWSKSWCSKGGRSIWAQISEGMGVVHQRLLASEIESLDYHVALFAWSYV